MSHVGILAADELRLPSLLFDQEVSVTVPYWHEGEKARQVFEEIWSYLQIIEREGGFFTYDPQIERVLQLDVGFRDSLESYLTVSGKVADFGRVPERKSWWQFWK